MANTAAWASARAGSPAWPAWKGTGGGRRAIPEQPVRTNRNGCFLDQRKILCAATDCLATGGWPFGRAKLPLSRPRAKPLIPAARRQPSPPSGGLGDYWTLNT